MYFPVLLAPLSPPLLHPRNPSIDKAGYDMEADITFALTSDSSCQNPFEIQARLAAVEVWLEPSCGQQKHVAAAYRIKPGKGDFP